MSRNKMGKVKKEEIIDKSEKVLYSQDFSIFRLLTNSTTNVILIVAFLIMFTQYFVNGAEKELWMIIAIQVALICMIVSLTIFDYKGSFFYITNKRILYSQASQRRSKWVDLNYDDIKDIYCSSYNLVIISKDDKKYKLYGLAHPEKILEVIKTIKK